MGAPGYRSPLREVPDDAIPDPSFVRNLPGESEIEGQTKVGGDERLADSCKKEKWWLEAVRVAEEVEKIQKALDLTQMVSLTSLLSFLIHSMYYLLIPKPLSI